MPITLPPISRRRFLAGSIAAGAALLSHRYTFGAAAEPDPNRFALLSDIHIAADKAAKSRGVTMAEHLRQACDEVLQLSRPPAAALINGDCAYLRGHPEDYATMLELVKPVREAGIPLHLGFGNHDQREHFWNAIPADPIRAKAMEDRQVLVLETPRANWIMLDSLDVTNLTPGLVGKPQLQWLAAALDQRADKPAIVMVHHDPQSVTTPATLPTTTQPAIPKIFGLLDSKQLLEVLVPRKQVKALLYGHTHSWRLEKYEGLHLINLPAVAYVFKPTQPSGWVDANVKENGLSLELRCLEPKHPWHGEKRELAWRA